MSRCPLCCQPPGPGWGSGAMGAGTGCSSPGHSGGVTPSGAAPGFLVSHLRNPPGADAAPCPWVLLLCLTWHVGTWDSAGGLGRAEEWLDSVVSAAGIGTAGWEGFVDGEQGRREAGRKRKRSSSSPLSHQLTGTARAALSHPQGSSEAPILRASEMNFMTLFLCGSSAGAVP